MIFQYTIENFYSFREPTVVDFTVTSQAGDRPGMANALTGQRVNTVTGALGANASGKTNLLKPLGFLAWFITTSAERKPDQEILCERFAFDPETHDRPTRLTLHFEFEGEEYHYRLSFTPERVLEESLHRKKQRFAYLFERVWNDNTREYDFKSQDLGGAAKVPQRENASWLATALLQDHPFAVTMYRFFDSFYGNCQPDGRAPSHDAELVNVFNAAEYYRKHPDLLNRVSAMMADYDLGLVGVKTQKVKNTDPKGEEVEFDLPIAVHQAGNRTYTRALMQESRGTQALFVLLRYLLPVLDKGGIAFIDEFESGLHPHMVRAVVDLFFNPATNPKNAQLIATFHTDFLLRDTLHKYQTYLVEKDESLNSFAYRLDSIRSHKGGRAPRNVENLFEKYHAGAYGGVPDLV